MGTENPECPEILDVGEGIVEAADQYAYNLSLDYDGDLDHAPATSRGTYLDGSREDLEPLEGYQDGGYHPVHLGDCLGPGDRYRIIQKLGHGGFGTVWLCRDVSGFRYVALKIMASDVESDKIPDLTLNELDQSIAGAEYIATPLDHFTTHGPNGTHQCIILPVLGPCVSPNLWTRLDQDAATVLRRMAYQASQALDFLHSNRICHGDFRPSNILVKLANLDHLPEQKLLSLIGQPRKIEVRTKSAEDLPPSSPRYLVQAADIGGLGNEYLTDQICIIDFGESFSFSSPLEDLGIPENYLPPEVILEESDAIGPACDLWAFGCTLFEIREQLPLFYMIYENNELLSEMVRFFGKLPKEWWDRWEARADFFDEEGNWLREEEDWSLEVALSKPMEVFEAGENYAKGAKMSLETPEIEQKLMADLLYKLFRYDPSQRITAGEALNHSWFKM